ncbi:ATP-dependent DNA ligase [Variovorax paradoxus]|nr:ATP-dependent DNA ligase [Variovorax paradoxus]MBT2302752.1 ATP-dependent DNA ligase [Variovorax paradoxus]
MASTDLLLCPIEPVLAKVAEELPAGGDFLFEPKWDGFRAIIFRSAREVLIQSRDGKSLDRYFPDLHEVFLEHLPTGCVLDGEIVIATPGGLDFDALQQRIHPAASRIARLASETPASFVAFDLLALEGRELMSHPQGERRLLLEALLATAEPPLHLTPMTIDRSLALRWLQDFEGAGLDGVIAKPIDQPYLPGKRAMLKVKHVRTADCVVAGFRWHKSGRDAVGSLLLGLYDERDVLHHVGMTSSFDMATRKALARELEPLRERALEGHPWVGWEQTEGQNDAQRMPGARSRWSAGKNLSWEPLRIERVCEVKYDHLQRDRFRHATVFLRWRFDKPPRECRYDQLESTPPYELAHVFRPVSADR